MLSLKSMAEQNFTILMGCSLRRLVAARYPSSFGFPVTISVRRASGGVFTPIWSSYVAATMATACGSPLMWKAGRLHCGQLEKPINVIPGGRSFFFAHSGWARAPQ